MSKKKILSLAYVGTYVVYAEVFAWGALNYWQLNDWTLLNAWFLLFIGIVPLAFILTHWSESDD